MTKSQNAAAAALEEMLYAKVRRAMAKGATEAQALDAARDFWLEGVTGQSGLWLGRAR